ncbi:MAG: hypothetical protein N2513_06940 [Deltaproteobacteria bacterium]|nr:hypothetical protein [Deltaproteobacteria bacterium]
MLKKIQSLFRDRNFILAISLVLGMAWDGGAYFLKDAIIPLLAIIMTFSTTAVPSTVFRSVRSMIKQAIIGSLTSYLFYGGLLLVLNYLIIANRDFWVGFVIISAVPPAVAVIPFSIFLKAHKEFVLFGTIGAYITALFLTPLIMLILLGSAFINPLKVLMILVELIILPIVLSRVLIRTGVSQKIEHVKGTLINWTFFLVIYIITGLNRDVMLFRTAELIPVIVLSFLSTFVFGWIIELIGKLSKMKNDIVKGLILLGTYKNYGLAGGLALVFFTSETAVPATVASTMSIIYIIYLQIRFRKA